MNRREISEQRQSLEIQLKAEGFLDCLKFLELVEYLDPEKRKFEIQSWDAFVTQSYGREMVNIAIESIARRYEEAYKEVLELSGEYKKIGVVERISKYLETDHEEFTSWLKSRA